MAAPEILILDLQTSGLYLKTMSLDSDQQPWAPYMAALQCDRDGRVVNHFATYIKADGRQVKNGAIEKHNIDAAMCNRIGLPQNRALGFLIDMLKVSPFDTALKVVTYGDMDRMVIASMLARFAISIGRPSNTYDQVWLSRKPMQFIDLQKPYAQHACAIQTDDGDGGFKWPTFAEATQKFLGREPNRDGLHDILLMKDLYFEFVKQGFIEREE